MIPFWCACCTAWQTADEQLQPLPRGQVVVVAELGDRHALDQFHDEVRPAASRWRRRRRPWRCSGGPSAPGPAARPRTGPPPAGVSMPGLITFRATCRRTGCCCSATNTSPIPPSPICSISLYGPMIVPGVLGRGLRTALAGRIQVRGGAIPGNCPTGRVGVQQALEPPRRRSSSAARLRSRYAARWPPGRRDRGEEQLVERSFWGSVSSAPVLTGPVTPPVRRYAGRESGKKSDVAEMATRRLGPARGATARRGRTPSAVGGDAARCRDASAASLDGQTGEVAELDQLGREGVVRRPIARWPRRSESASSGPGPAARLGRVEVDAVPAPAALRTPACGGRLRRGCGAWPRPPRRRSGRGRSSPVAGPRRRAGGTPRGPGRWPGGSGPASPRPAVRRRACAARRRRAAATRRRPSGRRPPRRRGAA